VLFLTFAVKAAKKRNATLFTRISCKIKLDARQNLQFLLLSICTDDFSRQVAQYSATAKVVGTCA